MFERSQSTLANFSKSDESHSHNVMQRLSHQLEEIVFIVIRKIAGAADVSCGGTDVIVPRCGG